jgi:hypothetical protein
VDLLSRDHIVAALSALSDRLAALDVRAECYLVGGAVMCLVLHARPATKDVAAWFTEPQVARRAALAVAQELGLPDDWLNDAAKAFIPARAGFERWGSFSHLDVAVADDRTMLAMKCAAARTAQDADDIRVLAARLELKSPAQVLDVVLHESRWCAIPSSDRARSKDSWLAS